MPQIIDITRSSRTPNRTVNVLRHLSDYFAEFIWDVFTYSNNNHVQAVPGILKVSHKTQADSFKEKLQSKHHSEDDI